jgi:hypothetical protein
MQKNDPATGMSINPSSFSQLARPRDHLPDVYLMIQAMEKRAMEIDEAQLQVLYSLTLCCWNEQPAVKVPAQRGESSLCSWQLPAMYLESVEEDVR